MIDQQQAEQRNLRIMAFRAELEALQQAGAVTLSSEQQQGIARHHQQLLKEFQTRFDLDISEPAHKLSLGMRMAALIGALALAASLFFLFYRIWGWFNEALQIVLLVGAPLLCLAASAWLKRLEPNGYFAQLGALLTVAAFIINLLMLGQIFNLIPSDNALLAWAGLSLLLAYALRLRLLLFCGLCFLLAFIAARIGTWSGAYWLNFGERPENFFPAALVFLALPQVWPQTPGFARIYRVLGLCALLLPILVLANWGQGSYLQFDYKLIESSYQLLGFVLAAAAVALGIRRGLSEVTHTGLTFFLIFLLTKFFDWWWDVLPKYLFFLLLGLLAVLALLVMRRVRHAHSQLIHRQSQAL